MGSDKHEKSKREAEPTYVLIFSRTLDAPAWIAMSLGARLLYIALRRRCWDNKKTSPDKLINGRLFLSQRDAAREIGTHHTQIARWFRELQHFGFLVMTKGGSLGVDGKGKAPHWRLTEFATIVGPPTRDFERWEGQKFIDRKLKSRAGKSAHPVPGSQHTSGRLSSTLESESVPGSQHIGDPSSVPGSQHINSSHLPSPLPSRSVTPSTRLAKRAHRGAVASEPPLRSVPISAELVEPGRLRQGRPR